MTHSVNPRYHDGAGALHEIRFERTAGGRWRVLDVGPHGAELVEELTGRDDGRSQAEALARDYATQAQLAARGGPEDDREMVWAA
jgi:hypothetical protein